MEQSKIDSRDLKILERANIDKRYIREILDRMRVGHGSRILDLGCGRGGSTEIIQEYDDTYKVTGVDKRADLIVVANKGKHGNTNYCVGDATALDFAEATFDVVFSRMLFEVCNEVDQILDEMIRVVVENGTLAIMGNLSTTPMIYPEPKHYGKYRISEERLLQKTKDTVYNPLSLVGKLKEREIKNVYFHPYYKTTLNCGKKDIYDYYFENKSLEDNLLVKSMLMDAGELEEFYNDFDSIMEQESTVVVYSQFYIIASRK